MRTLWAASKLQAHVDIDLDEDEARHGRAVLRLQVGDAVRLIDGLGHWTEATVSAVGKKLLSLKTGSVQTDEPQSASQLHVYVAAPKGSRFEDMVRGLSELGVGTVSPLRCERSVRDPNVHRAQRVAREASKQCGRAYVTQVSDVVDFPSLADCNMPHILLDPHGKPPKPGPCAPTALVIGPEGGFTDEEIEQMQSWGAQPTRLASSILRIETAAIAAAAVWTAAWEQ